MGFKMTVTGGVEVKDIHLFKDIPIYIFIAGRSIRDAENPELAAKEFKDEFKNIDNKHFVGIYEKAIDKHYSFEQKLKLQKQLVLISLN